MIRHLPLLVAIVVAGCSDGEFANRIEAAGYCDPSLNGIWVPDAEFNEDLGEDDVQIRFELTQSSECANSVVTVTMTEPGESYVLTWLVDFVRISGRIFANARLVDIGDEEFVGHQEFYILELDFLAEDRVSVLMPDSTRLIEMIDTGKLDGSYQRLRHETTFSITNDGASLRDILPAEVGLFEHRANLERPDVR